MPDADILRSLRDQVLDESESLVGLLRKCLALGAVTGSEELRTWATNELKGYNEGATLPSYRSISAPLFVDSIGGTMHMSGQQINHLQIPKDLRQYVPELVNFRQSIEEIVQMAAATNEDSHKIVYQIFSLVTARWSAELPMFQDITGMYYRVGSATLTGIVGAVRTSLVEIVIDLAKDVPLDSLPSKAKVDSVVQVHVGPNEKYEVNVAGSNSGIIGQGAGSTQIQNSSVPSELNAIVNQLRAALDIIDDPDQRADAQQAITDFEESVSEDNPQPEKVKRRWGIIERVGTALGSAVLTQAVKEGAPVVTDYLQLLM